MIDPDESDQSKVRFMQELRHHLAGWREKVKNDFAKDNYDKELNQLSSDPVYAKFKLATADYILIRLMGRMSVSIGRRLGEIYDKIPRIAAQARYSLTRDKVVAKFGGLELDIRLSPEDLEKQDVPIFAEICKKHLDIDIAEYAGIGIEIRYNFNPNDSSRLRKDKHLADLLEKDNYYPIYLIFAENSPRLEDAVTSLTRAGWTFIVGEPALRFMADLVGFDISSILDEPEVAEEIQKEMELLMSEMQSSYAFNKIKRFQQ